MVDPRDKQYVDLPHIGAGNMVTKSDQLVAVQTAREEGLKSAKFFFNPRMVLYSKIRPYLMKVCRPEFDGLCSADVYPLLPNPRKLNRDYLFYVLLSRHFTEFAIAGSDRAGMPKVNREHLFRYRFPLPDVSAQQTVTAKLDNLGRLCRELAASYSAKTKALARLKQSILAHAFTGRLTNSELRVAAE
ncbi:MAG: restriction endonuclease subunit S [Alphaproteobacteria bacterium]|nr:restriction endonuclease subunit S [Alphaproteobacteria bacterium]